MTFQNIILTITATTTALIAGLFYSWTVSVMPGLARLSNSDFIKAMQSFNVTIQNPLFFLSFIGTALMLPVCTYFCFGQPVSTRFWLLLGASIVYLIGVLGVTVFGNIPLNDALENFDIKSASIDAIREARLKFENPWNRLNTIRTISSTTAIILVIIGCISRDN